MGIQLYFVPFVQGTVVAVDKSKSKVKKMKSLCKEQDLTCIQCIALDSTKLCSANRGIYLCQFMYDYRGIFFKRGTCNSLLYLLVETFNFLFKSVEIYAKNMGLKSASSLHTWKMKLNT